MVIHTILIDLKIETFLKTLFDYMYLCFGNSHYYWCFNGWNVCFLHWRHII